MTSSTTLNKVGPTSLKNVAVDVSSRLGVLAPPTPVGLPTLENLLGGGLRAGDFMTLSGDSGVGKTSLGLFLAYLAARSGAAALLVSSTLTQDEVLARLAARALFREKPKAGVTYGQIWSGQAWKDDKHRKGVQSAVDTVVKKVGSLFHFQQIPPFESVETIAAYAAMLWGKHERVVLVVDNLEALRVSAASSADLPAHIAYALRKIADDGCAVVATAPARAAAEIAPAATLATELRQSQGSTVGKIDERLVALGARNVDLVVTKNRVGPAGIIPLRFVAGTATFEERAP